MKLTRLACGLSLALLAFSTFAQQPARKPYIVQLTDAPASSYDGRVPGYRATRPAAGSRLNVNASDVQAYIGYLAAKQTNVVAAIPGAPVTYRYRVVLNGFATWLTDAELLKLAANAGVKRISPDIAMPLDTATTPRFLGIDQAGGAWSRTDASGRAVKGEGVIIGHVDGGVWPENPSFSDKVDAQGKPIASHLPGTLVYDALPPGRYAGICQEGLGFDASHCNNKLVGASFFNTTWKLAVSLGIVTTWSGEYLDSPRDADGHGTHTLSTSGGNQNVDVTVSGSPFTISGIAPRARVAAYKSCYTPQNAQGVPGQGTCFQSDSVAAIERAVGDGVDVINFSISGSQTSANDAVGTAFLEAALAGVFVSASAGNSGPGNNVAHPNPWVMTVANSTHDRFTEATVTLGNGFTATGPSFQTGGVPSTPMILAVDAGLPGADPLLLSRCYGGDDGVATLDPAKVAGKIVVCYRGGNVLVNKSAAVKEAGGTAMILQNIPAGVIGGPSADTTFAIPHVVPTVHLTAASANAVIGYAGGAGATASFGPGVQVAGVVAPVMSGTSSRGPNKADPNVLKPEITAPGTDIIAAYTNTSITPEQRLQIIYGTLIPGPGADMISGTSMSSPHVAGAAALLRQANPTWSPYAIKSALLTSAVQSVKLANGTPDPDRWGYGAGHLNPNDALSTRVVYDQSPSQHINYYFGLISGRDINLATLTHANVVGVGTLTRTLTNKGTAAASYTASASLPGFDVTVSPSSLSIPPGGSATFTVTLRRTSVPIETWSFGNLTWSTTSGPALRSPLTAKASELVAPDAVSDTRAVGTKVFSVGTGYNGTLLLQPNGLLAASQVGARIATGQLLCLTLQPVAPGTRKLRGQLFNVDTEGGSSSDLDLLLRVQTGPGAFSTVASSGAVDSNELVELDNPTVGATYQICIDGFAPANGNAGFLLSYWVLPAPSGPQTLRAMGPSRVTTGGTASVALAWNVPAGKRYIGVVDYRSVAGGPVIGSTDLFVDNAPSAAALAKIDNDPRLKPER